MDARDDFADLKAGFPIDDMQSKLSGNPDLSRLSPAQIDRLEQEFQQAITDDRRLHRLYVFLDSVHSEATK